MPVRRAYQPAKSGGFETFLAHITDTTPAVVSPLTASPARVLFRHTQGEPAPVAQIVSVGPPGISFNPIALEAWISVTAQSEGVRISVDPSSLVPGTHNGIVRLSPASGLPISIEVTLTVLAAAPQLTEVSPAVVAIGSDDTVITIRGSGFTRNTVVQVDGAPWMNSAVTFVDSSTLRIRFPKIYFTVEYNHSIIVSNPDSALSNALSVAVGRVPPQVSNGGVVSAASYAGGTISPGEIVTIFGSNFGESTRVLFDETPATLIYVATTQLSASVPYDLPRANSTTLIVESQGLRSAPVTMPIIHAKPALFTSDATGKGQAASLNQDSSVNTASNPAERGSIIVLYGTGGGALSGDQLALPVKVFVDDIEAEVLYSGIAPGLVSGAVQINVRLPEAAVEGSIIVRIGEAESQSGVTVALQGRRF